MAQIYIKNQISGAGITIDDQRTITADNVLNAGETSLIPAGIAGTAGSAGVMTVATGHGLQNSDVVAVSGAFGVYYNATISQAGTNVVTVSGGAGDALPTSGAVVISKKTPIDFSVTGANLQLISIGADTSIIATLEDADSVNLVVTAQSGGAYTRDAGNGATNPLAGDSVTVCNVYNASMIAGLVKIIIAYNNSI